MMPSSASRASARRPADPEQRSRPTARSGRSSRRRALKNSVRPRVMYASRPHDGLPAEQPVLRARSRCVVDVVRVHEPHGVVQVGVDRDAQHERQHRAVEVGDAAARPPSAADARDRSTESSAPAASPRASRSEPAFDALGRQVAPGLVPVRVERDDRRRHEPDDEQRVLRAEAAEGPPDPDAQRGAVAPAPSRLRRAPRRRVIARTPGCASARASPRPAPPCPARACGRRSARP